MRIINEGDNNWKRSMDIDTELQKVKEQTQERVNKIGTISECTKKQTFQNKDPPLSIDTYK